MPLCRLGPGTAERCPVGCCCCCCWLTVAEDGDDDPPWLLPDDVVDPAGSAAAALRLATRRAMMSTLDGRTQTKNDWAHFWQLPESSHCSSHWRGPGESSALEG